MSDRPHDEAASSDHTAAAGRDRDDARKTAGTRMPGGGDVVRAVRSCLPSGTAGRAYTMSAEDAVRLDGMLELACAAMDESETSNARLRARNAALERVCADHGRTARERDRLRRQLDHTAADLRLALGRGADHDSDDRDHDHDHDHDHDRDRDHDRDNDHDHDHDRDHDRDHDDHDRHGVKHLINVCAALWARDSECRHVEAENVRLTRALDEQRDRVRAAACAHLDGVREAVEKLARDLSARDDGLLRESVHEKITSPAARDELLCRSAKDDDLGKEYRKLRHKHELIEENARVKSSIDKYREMLTEKDARCNDADRQIRTLNLYIRELVSKYNRVLSAHDGEKAKCRTIVDRTRKTIKELKAQIYKKDNKIRSVQDECCSLRNRFSLAEVEIDNLKRNFLASDQTQGGENKIITRQVDAEIDWKNEVLALKKELKLESAQIILTERIAKLQLTEACNNIQYLIQTFDIKLHN